MPLDIDSPFLGNAEFDFGWRNWLGYVYQFLDKLKHYEVDIDPASVSANSTSEQTFTVTGLTTQDIVLAVNKPSETSGLIVGNARVSDDDEIAITFANITGSPINAGEETYEIVVIRKD